MPAPRTPLPALSRWASWAGVAAFVISLSLQLSIWPVFEYERSRIRSEMKWKLLRSVPQEDLITFRFTRAAYVGLDFHDGGKEVALDGVMHDIVRTVADQGGMVRIEVVRDEAETELLAGLDSKVRAAQERDARGEHERRVLTSGWACFHESSAMGTFEPPVFDRYFHDLPPPCGRIADCADPGPPRMA